MDETSEVTVTVHISETFEKWVEVNVPHVVSDKGAKAMVEWIRENIDARVLDAGDTTGTDDPAEDMDYKQEVSICQ